MIPSQLLEEVPCDAIQLVGRYRRDMGDLEALATSIATEGFGHRSDDTVVTVIEDGQQSMYWNSAEHNAKQGQWRVKVGRVR